MSAHDRVIVALDVDTESQARAIVESLGDAASFYKIGLQLLTAAGPALMRELVASGKQVFLDLKLFEIPNSVAGAVRAAGAQGVTMITVHASAEAAGCHGVVASPHEVTMLRTVLGRHMLIVTPGIQRVGEGATDQARAATPSHAIAAGATHIVIGRSITQAANPCAAFAGVCADVERAGVR